MKARLQRACWWKCVYLWAVEVPNQTLWLANLFHVDIKVGNGCTIHVEPPWHALSSSGSEHFTSQSGYFTWLSRTWCFNKSVSSFKEPKTNTSNSPNIKTIKQKFLKKILTNFRVQCIKGIKNYISNYTSWALLRWWNSSKLFNIQNPRLLLQSHFKPTDGGSSRVITRRSRLVTRCAATSQSPIKIIQTRRPITIRYIEPCTETLFLKVTTSCVQKTNHSNTKKQVQYCQV